MINSQNLENNTLIKVLRILISFQKKLGYFVIFAVRLLYVLFRLVLDLFRLLVKRIFSIKLPKIRIGKFRFHVVSFCLGTFFAAIFIFFPLKVYAWYRDLPRPDLLLELGDNKTTKILDRNGKLLYEIYIDRKYDHVDLEEIPQHVIQATLAIEDDAFYSHLGFRVDSILRAAKATVFEDELQGASTITQQLVKNVLLTSERTVPRKLKELVLAILVENKFSKDEILELYMNNIPYGGTAWGIEAASQKFFGKDVTQLDLAEASMLAGLPSAPSVYSPLRGDLGVSKRRQKQVLDRMVSLGYISSEEAKEAYAKDLVFAPQVEFIKAPHFVFYVRDMLEREYGQRLVEFGGLTVVTTLDLDLQEKVEELVAQGVSESAYLNISNGATVVLDAKRSEILAYVGSVDYFHEGWGSYDVVTAFRQPGSSIKPVTYALAFQKGLSPATVIDDKPVTYSSYGEVYKPVNYDGKFHGKVTLRQALANSYNVPAVKLVEKVGTHDMVALGSALGLSGWEVDDSYGLSVTLGGKEVRLLDLTNVYATLARKGIYQEVSPLISVKDAKGYELYDRSKTVTKRVLSEEVAYLLSNILSDNVARTPAFGSHSSLVIPGQIVAAKTGTTDSKRDNWTFGYTSSYVVGVWVGNNDNTPMNQYLASGLSGASPIWNKVMTTVLEGSKAEPFEVPGGIYSWYDSECNRSEIFIKGTKLPEHLCEIKKEDDKKD